MPALLPSDRKRAVADYLSGVLEHALEEDVGLSIHQLADRVRGFHEIRKPTG
ncbi:MAG: hypothetical protein NTU88_11225 [Armatimonadetes bacterium]|nr:hypothetical protein [Armatimonadota bacterium]